MPLISSRCDEVVANKFVTRFATRAAVANTKLLKNSSFQQLQQDCKTPVTDWSQQTRASCEK